MVYNLQQSHGHIHVYGKTLLGAEVARDYGIKDTNGNQPPSYRDRYGVAPVEQHPFIIRG